MILDFSKNYPNYLRNLTKEIGADIMGLFDIFNKKKSSSDYAKDRLKLLLVSDRANCSPDIMEQIKNDIIEVISRYMEIDATGLDIQITQTESEGGHGSVPALYANIPIKDLKSKSVK